MNSTHILYKIYKACTAVTTDTRNVKPGFLFFALKGPHFDGNTFADEALEKGAIAAVIDNPQYAKDSRYIVVENALESLQDLAAYHRSKLKTLTIGLTGSNGKTSTKELIFNVLKQAGETIATAGNLNNHIGVPLTLLRIQENTSFAVVEMGANAHGEIAFLSSLCQPDIGYITNFGYAHLEGFGSPEGVIEAKSELYQYLHQHNKEAIVNADDPIQLERTTGIKRFLFGNSVKNDLQCHLIEENEQGLLIEINDHRIQTNMHGRYNFSNICAAVALGVKLAIPIHKITEGIGQYIPQNNRSQWIKTKKNELLMDAYNANPSSMEVALENAKNWKGEKWLILGDMFELGKYSEAEHLRIAHLAIQTNAENIILVGKLFGKTNLGNFHFQETDHLLEWLKKNIPEGKKILIKGSRGMALEKILQIL